MITTNKFKVELMNIEVKGNLAKLMATENLIIEHRQVNTASFNVETRTLTLPIWKVSNNVYDMLVGHEVGHALHTPSDYVNIQNEIPQSYLNIVEDARIEKLMKRKFPGLSRNFYSGYQELYKNNFFDTKGRDISSLLLIDRINLSFKIGLHADTFIPFTEKEKELVKLVETTETFSDVIYAARKILEFSKNNKSETQSNSSGEIEKGSSGSSDSSEKFDEVNDSSDTKYDTNQTTKSDNSESSQSKDDNSSVPNTNGGDEKSFDDLESITDKSLNKFQESIIDYEAREIKYVEIPDDFSLDSIITSNKDIHDLLDKAWKNTPIEHINKIKSDYIDYRNKNLKEVNYLVKEFEMKKSAERYAKSSISKTGILNTSKIYSYKWNEDIFKKINIIPDGKNHGLIFILDWSGSMTSCLFETVKQVINLIWFCNKTQIPFDVYCFTNNGFEGNDVPEHHTLKSNQIYIDRHFKLLNILSSSSKINVETQLFNFWKVTQSICQKYDSQYSLMKTPPLFHLSGTPLMESIIVLHKLIPNFKSKVNCEKLNVIILSDGDSNPIYQIHDVNKLLRTSNKGDVCGNSLNDCSLRDKTTGRIYPPFESYHSNIFEATKIFLQSVSDKFPDVNLIGIRLLSSNSEFNSLYRNNSKNSENTYDSDIKIWKKNKYFEFLNCGYKVLYTISIDNLSSPIDFLTLSSRMDSNLKSDFIKSQKAKVVNKKMLSSFVSLIS